MIQIYDEHHPYTKVQKLPGGAYAKIYKCKCEAPIKQHKILPWLHQQQKNTEVEDHPKYVVMKKFMSLKKKVGLDIDSLREVRFMNTIQHPNLNIPKQIFVTKKKKKEDENFGAICFIYDYMISLFNLIYSNQLNQTWEEMDIKKMMYQILKGFEFLHSKMIIHRDFKPQNVLINFDGQLKITDFGLARMWEDRPMTIQPCTIQYRAPELCFCANKYSQAVDIWSIGCVFAEFYLKRPLFQGDSLKRVLASIVDLLGNPNEQIWPGYTNLPQVLQFTKTEPLNFQRYFSKMTKNGIDLLQKMIQYDPNKRITAKDALKHPYFDDLKQQPGDQYSKKMMDFIQMKLSQ